MDTRKPRSDNRCVTAMNPHFIFEFSRDGKLLAVFLQAESTEQENMLREKLKTLRGMANRKKLPNPVRWFRNKCDRIKVSRGKYERKSAS